jgi:hypothetical protein
MAQRMVTCDIPRERETFQACSNVSRVLSYVGGRQGCRLSENGDASREGVLRAWVCPNTVDRDGAATFSNQVWKGPAGEEHHKAMVWKIPKWRVHVYCKTRRPTRPFGGWAEMDYQFHVCRVTKGGHIEHLQRMQNELGEFLFLSVCRMLPSFAPFKCTNFL